MRVFVTGGTGFIGEHIVCELLEAGDDVTVLTRSSNAIKRGAKIVIGDLTDVASWASCLQGHEALVHNALVWEDEPTELELCDPHASISLYREAAAAGVQRVLYTSSQAVHRPYCSLMTEESPLRPSDLYGATKATNEILLLGCAEQFGFMANIVRPGPTVGAPVVGGRHKSDRRIEEFVSLAQAGADIHVPEGEGRQFTAVTALARTYSALLRTKFHREVFLCCDPLVITWEEIARLVVAATESSSHIVVSGPPATKERFAVTKAERAFGIELDAISAIKDHIQFLAGC